MLDYYLKHQKEVVTRRTLYDLNKAEERAHILQGLLIALDNIDEVIRIIRASANGNAAKEKLIERFALTDVQAQAIIDMRLRALTGLERERLEAEFAELMIKIAEYKAILADEKKLLGVIKEEITLIRDKFGDERRTKIGFDEFDISMEDLIPNETTVIAMTRLGYIKRMTVDNFKSQHRGGKGIKGMQTIEEDFIEDLLMTTNHHYIMFFTNKGRVYRLKAYEIPEAGRTARGTAIVNLLQLLPEERITAIIPLKEYKKDRFLFMATKKGIVKKTPMSDYEHIRKSGLQAINLREDDELIEVKSTNHLKDVILVTKDGMCIRFNERDVRPTGRTSMGVIGMNLNEEDEIVGMQLHTQGAYLLFVSENGLGKRTEMDEFTVQRRGGKGVKCYKITEKTGDVIGVKAVNEENEVMLITNEGIIIRIMVNDISVLGRITSGVKLMDIAVDNKIKVANLTKVRESTASEEELIKNLENELNEENQVVDTSEFSVEDAYDEFSEDSFEELVEESESENEDN
jgi:DNA gyrase subunit A